MEPTGTPHALRDLGNVAGEFDVDLVVLGLDGFAEELAEGFGRGGARDVGVVLVGNGAHGFGEVHAAETRRRLRLRGVRGLDGFGVGSP